MAKSGRRLGFWFLDSLGWPVETIKGRPVFNFLRLIIHTRRITRTWEAPKQGLQVFSKCSRPFNGGTHGGRP